MAARRPALIVLAGPVCAGKTTLAGTLAEVLNGEVLAARAVITQHSPDLTRVQLQNLGAELEKKTDGRWLAQAASDRLGSQPLIVDAAKTAAQLKVLFELGQSTMAVYLDASQETCRERFQKRDDPVDRGQSFDQLMQGEFAEQPGLREGADLVIATDDLSPEQVSNSAIAALSGRPET